MFVPIYAVKLLIVLQILQTAVQIKTLHFVEKKKYWKWCEKKEKITMLAEKMVCIFTEQLFRARSLYVRGRGRALRM